MVFTCIKNEFKLKKIVPKILNFVFDKFLKINKFTDKNWHKINIY